MGAVTAEHVADERTRVYHTLEDWIFTETGGTVQTGPFQGMRLLQDQSWKDGNLSSKCLGCYEEELHPFIREQIRRLVGKRAPKIVDLGCAEGYYAVGLAMRVPIATVYGVDISKDALRITNEAAALNGVHVHTGVALLDAMAEPDLVVCDVEGAEPAYLDLRKFPALARSDILVECHDFDDKPHPVTATLIERFKETHEIEYVCEGARNPNKFPVLVHAESIHRWMAVCEGRPCMMHWLQMKVRR